MFDDQAQQNTPANLPTEPQPQTGAMPQQPAAPAVELAPEMPGLNQASPGGAEPEDIFAETEHDSAGGAYATVDPANPQQIQDTLIAESSVDQARVATAYESDGGMGKKIALIVGVVVIAAAIGYGLFWYYQRLVAEQLETATPINTTAPATTVPVVETPEPVTPPPVIDTSTPSVETAPVEPAVEPELSPEQQAILESIEEAVAEEEAEATAAALDSDGDGLLDAEEDRLGTDALASDSDEDGLDDGEEVNEYRTNPLIADTDGDGYNDGQEVENGYNPLGEGKLQ
jgi:hypothetical protein